MNINEIRPYDQNAKKHPEKQVEQIARSIKEFGFNQPIVIDRYNEIIVGHGRYFAAQKLGLVDVPVTKLDNLTDDQVQAYRLADNKLNESEWEMSLVIENLKYLDSQNYDITITGFDKDLILEPDAKDDIVPDNAPTRAKLGDLWALGKHRLYCGDSTNLDAVMALSGETKADMFLTDPPYNVDYVGKTKDALQIENDKMSDEAFTEFLSKAFTSADEVMKDGAVFYIWHADMQSSGFIKATANVGWHWAEKLIWVKNTMVLGRQDYHWKHEPCLYGWKKGANHVWNSDRTQTTVLNFDRPTQNKSHPTMKPVDLLSYQITNNTKGEDIVLDLFGGSGSTLIAAEKTGRICYMMELDEKYVDVIIERYEQYTGNKATKLN